MTEKDMREAISKFCAGRACRDCPLRETECDSRYETAANYKLLVQGGYITKAADITAVFAALDLNGLFAVEDTP